MLFPIILIPVIGLLISVGDLSKTIKLALLGALGAAMFFDFMHAKKRSRPLRNKSHIITVALFQALLSYSWINVYFSNPIGFEISRFMLVVMAGFPWIVIWQVIATEYRFRRIMGLSPVGIGIIAWGCCSTLLSRLGVGAESSMLAYGRAVEGSFMGEFRSILPGFSGIVVGGVFCGIALAFSFSGFLLSVNNINRFAYLVAIVLTAYGIYVTDVRSAAGVTVVVLILGLAYVLSCKSSEKGGSTILASLIRRMIVLSAALPMLAPVIIPGLDALTERVSIPFVSTALVRSESESILSFGGRSKIWEIAVDIATSEKVALFAFNSIGENGAGVSQSLFETGLMPGNSESAHSHNTALNFYFSFGALGLVIFGALLLQMCRAFTSNRLVTNQLAYLLPFFAIMVFMTLESLLSVTYTYFGLCFTLFNIDLFREANSEPHAI